MDFDAALSSLNSVYRYPWSAKTHLFFTINDEPLLVKAENGKDFITYPANFIIGPRLVNDIVDLGSKRHVVGITFRAGILQRLIGLPMHELTNKGLDSTLILGKEINEMEMRLKEAKGNNAIQCIIENFLLKKVAAIKKMESFDLAISELVKHNGNISIEKISNLTGISTRHLERKCLERLGMPPKLFARLTRFAKAYILKENQHNLSWASIAYECGYYDQMHLIRDFKSFSGYTPTAIDNLLPTSIKVVTALEGCY